MKLRHLFSLPVVAACLWMASPSAHATVTISFEEAGVGRATGFSNSAGVVGINGMRWGIVVDTNQNLLSGAGPLPTQMYDADSFNFTTGGFLTTSIVTGPTRVITVTDDYFFPSLSQSDFVTPLLTSTRGATGTDPGGPGGIIGIGSVPFGGGTGISAGDPFGIIWFPTAGTPNFGDPYGLLQNQAVNQQFDIPADGATVNLASTFFSASNPAADSIKAANLIMQGVPEPSRLILLGVGAMGLLLRRRRS